MDNTLHLFIVTACQWMFGVCAEHVEEVLEGGLPKANQPVSTESTLQYRGSAIRLIHFSAWLALKESDSAAQTFAPHRPQSAESAALPKIVIVKHPVERFIGVQIDDVREFLPISVTQIHSMPILMQKTSRIPGLWGIVVLGEHLVVLIDLTQL